MNPNALCDHLRCQIRIIPTRLGQIIVQLVVAALVITEDMRRQPQARIAIKRSRKDRHIHARPIPKKVRAAGTAEPAPCSGGGGKPRDRPVNRQGFTRHRGRCHMVTRGLSALRAMASNHRAQRPVGGKMNCPTQAGPGLHRHAEPLLLGTA